MREELGIFWLGAEKVLSSAVCYWDFGYMDFWLVNNSHSLHTSYTNHHGQWPAIYLWRRVLFVCFERQGLRET